MSVNRSNASNLSRSSDSNGDNINIIFHTPSNNQINLDEIVQSKQYKQPSIQQKRSLVTSINQQRLPTIHEEHSVQHNNQNLNDNSLVNNYQGDYRQSYTVPINMQQFHRSLNPKARQSTRQLKTIDNSRLSRESYSNNQNNYSSNNINNSFVNIDLGQQNHNISYKDQYRSNKDSTTQSKRNLQRVSYSMPQSQKNNIVEKEVLNQIPQLVYINLDNHELQESYHSSKSNKLLNRSMVSNQPKINSINMNDHYELEESYHSSKSKQRIPRSLISSSIAQKQNIIIEPQIGHIRNHQGLQQSQVQPRTKKQLNRSLITSHIRLQPIDQSHQEASQIMEPKDPQINRSNQDSFQIVEPQIVPINFNNHQLQESYKQSRPKSLNRSLITSRSNYQSKQPINQTTPIIKNEQKQSKYNDESSNILSNLLPYSNLTQGWDPVSKIFKVFKLDNKNPNKNRPNLKRINPYLASQ